MSPCTKTPARIVEIPSALHYNFLYNVSGIGNVRWFRTAPNIRTFAARKFSDTCSAASRRVGFRFQHQYESVGQLPKSKRIRIRSERRRVNKHEIKFLAQFRETRLQPIGVQQIRGVCRQCSAGEQPQIFAAHRLRERADRTIVEQGIRQSMMIRCAEHFRQRRRAQVRFDQADRTSNIFCEGLCDTDADSAAAVSMIDPGKHNHVRRLLRLQQEHSLHKTQNFFSSQEVEIEAIRLAMAFSVAVAMAVAKI